MQAGKRGSTTSALAIYVKRCNRLASMCVLRDDHGRWSVYKKKRTLAVLYINKLLAIYHATKRIYYKY